MVDFQTFKLLCITMILLGLYINKKVNISFDANLEDEKQRIAFKKILIKGLLQSIDAQSQNLNTHILDHILNLLENDCYKEPSFEELFKDSINWVHGNEYYSLENFKKVKNSLNNIKTIDFNLDVEIKEGEIGSINTDNNFQGSKTLKLEAIEFDEIVFKEKNITIGDKKYSSKWNITPLYEDLLKGLTFKDSFTIHNKEFPDLIAKFYNSSNISLKIASLNDITIVFDKPGQNKELILL